MPVRQEQHDTTFATEILARLASAGSMWSELQKVLAVSSADISSDEVERLIVEKNVLAKATLANRRKVARKLVQRYTLDASDPVFAAFRHEYDREPTASQRALLGYLMMTTNDALMRALGTQWLVPKLDSPGEELRYEDLEAGLDALAEDHPQVSDWADSTRTRVMQHYLGAIRDFGFAEGVQTKRVVRPRVGDRPIAFAAQLSLLEGLSGPDFAESDWFRLLGLGTGATVNRLLDLNATGLARVRIRGDVIDLQFSEEVDTP